MRTTILIWRLYWIKFNVPWTINWAISWNSNMTPIYRENVYLCWKIEFNHILHLLVGNISGKFAVKSNSTSAQKLQIGEVHLECAFFQSSISKCPQHKRIMKLEGAHLVGIWVAIFCERKWQCNEMYIKYSSKGSKNAWKLPLLESF